MMKISPFTNILFPLVTILFCAISQCLAALSDKQLCYDPDCTEAISLARTILAYRANDREVMSFDINADVKVFSKGAGKRTDLWGVEIKGQRGFAPKSFLNEYKVLQSVLSYEVPVYKFTDEDHKVRTKKSESKEKIHKAHPVLKDKLTHDNEALPFSAEDVDKNVQKERIGSIEKIHKSHPSLKDKLPRDDDEEVSLTGKSVDKIVHDSEIINANNTSPSYEVIDGTTLYLESKQSIQPSFVTDAVHVTALPNKQTSPSYTDTEVLDNKDGKIALPTEKELQSNTNNIDDKFEGIKSPIDIPKEIDTEVQLESSEAIINSTIGTVSRDDGSSISDESGKSEDNPSENLEIEESMGDDAVESEGIFASLARKFTILTDSQETIVAESIASQNSNDAPVSETDSEDNLYLHEQSSDNIEVESAVTEENIPYIKGDLYPSIDPSMTGKDDTEREQEEIIHENIESAKISDEMRIQKEASPILLENPTSPSNVPSSNNFVHEDANKPAKDLPTETSVLASDSSTSIEADITSRIKNIEMQETSEQQKVAGNIRTEGIITSLEEGPTILSDAEEIAITKSVTTQNSNDNEQEIPVSSETYLEDTKDDVDYEKTVPQDSAVAATNKIPETDNLSIVEETLEDTTKRASSDSNIIGGSTIIINGTLDRATDIHFNDELIVHSDVNKTDNIINGSSSDNVPVESNEFSNDVKPNTLDSEQSMDSSQQSVISEQILTNVYEHRRLLNTERDSKLKNTESQIDNPVKDKDKISSEYDGHIISEDEILYEDNDVRKNSDQMEESKSILDEIGEVCSLDQDCTTKGIVNTPEFLEQQETESKSEEDYMIDVIKLDHDYLKMLIYLSVTAFTTLLFTLGYYYIENIRRDSQLIARINKLEKELLISMKECEALNENLKSTKEKLHCIEDESFGSNEMVLSLKADLEASQNVKTELEDQVTMLEKDLENATEAGLELERMLREVLSSNNEVNPLAQSVEDLQARLDAQQATNESLTNALNLKTQEVETLSIDLATTKKKREEFEVKFSRAKDELTTQENLKNNIEQTLKDQVQHLEVQVKELSAEKSSLYKELKSKETEIKELAKIIDHVNSNNLDLEKLYDISRVKTEVVQVREERDELKTRLSDVEGAHQLLEEHMKLVKEEIAELSDQCKIAEKEKKEAETRLDVLSKFFKEKEAERQREEAIWMQKQGEVVSTVEKIHMMQNEIQNYKQQIEMLKQEIVDQEREYKNQISIWETKAHEQWVIARQHERRLEESKAEAGQLRNRLTLVEKNLNDSDSETKLHRLEANGETATSPPLFIGAETSSSPVMFSGSSDVPPPPPSYLHCFPTYLPPLPPNTSGLPPYDINQRPPPLGGRLSSPPPMPPLHPPASGGRYENAGSPPPPMSPHLLSSFNRHRSPPPQFGSDHIPPPSPPGSILPPPLGTAHPWGEESLPPLRNSGFHPHQREQRARNHKGSLHSSGESLDKSHHGKV